MAAAWPLLKLAAQKATPIAVAEEYQELFIGIGRGDVVPYGSWYLTGSLMEMPLAHLRSDLKQLGYERNESVKEPEDHIAALLEVMVGVKKYRPILKRQKVLFFTPLLVNLRYSF